ncbi:gluconate 2-dehydrogenase subunit 3 family protein [Bradyrhizobium sp. 1.29L]
MRQERALLDPEDLQLDPRLRVPAGYGSDPNLVTPSTPWTLSLSKHQAELIDSLSDVILPGGHHVPFPSCLPISGFFNNWLSAPYAKQVADRKLISSGLDWLDDYANRNYGRQFLDLRSSQRVSIVEFMSTSWTLRPFFQRFRYLLIGGYFTSDAGLAVIGYAGNVPLKDYAGVPSELRALVEEELWRLGL